MNAPVTYAGHTWESAREWCLWIMQHNAAPGPAQNGQRAALDAFRAEVLREAAEVADQSVILFPDTIECAAAQGALEGIAIRLRRLADEAAPPTNVTVYRAEYEHEPFLPIGLYANAAAARAHCEHLVRQEWTPSTPLTFEWSVDEDNSAVIELDVRVDTDSWSTGYTVKAVVADAEFDPEADS